MSESEPRDLTAILLHQGEHDEAGVVRAVLAAGYGDLILRVAPLPGAALLQVEVLDEVGMPRVDPALVAALSEGGRRACFVHVNHSASQALLHRFQSGEEREGWVGPPAEIDAKLKPAFGHGLEEILDADDGSRRGFGVAASRTAAFLRGRQLVLPPGLPTGLGSFGFHDRGVGEAGDRVALIAHDPRALQSAWRTTPGSEIAARLATLPPQIVGPLAGVRERGVAAFAALGDRTAEAAGLADPLAYELLTLAESYVFAAGDALHFIDQRFLPLFSLAAMEPAIEGHAEATALEGAASVLEAMVEVLPFTSPEGSLLEQLGDDELAPLAPWVKPGEEYVGSLFSVRGQRLPRLVGGTDPRELAQRVDRFYGAWWKAGRDGSEEELMAWREGLDQKGEADIGRFLSNWAEWRLAVAVATANQLQLTLVFYGLAEGRSP